VYWSNWLRFAIGFEPQEKAVDLLAARIILLESGPRPARGRLRPVILRNPAGRRSSRPPAICVTWLDELPGSRRHVRM